jgi:hypothetical protein
MKREEAITKLSKKQLSELTDSERAEQLETMTLEDWSGSEGWNLLPKSLIKEFEEQELKDDPRAEKYDDILLLWLKFTLRAVSNEYMKKELGVEKIDGEPVPLESCPCCGSRTIGERGNYEICKVCWWEDDGQDNKHANKDMGGPNSGVSLTQGRINFINYGIYDPKRKDLIKIKEVADKYEKGRSFDIIDGHLIEKGTEWKIKIETNA